ncbi:hypothetical protein AALB39_27605 [Lachnospiraceae bacterium 54-53]
MKYTQNLNMKIPEGEDPIEITDITDNFETIDTEMAKKADSTGGDISNTTIKTVDTISAEFPIPSAGESSKTFLGKVKKFIQDFNDFKTGILTLGHLVNNGQTTEPGFALDARYGKTLYDLYAQLNANLNNKASLGTNGYSGRQIINAASGVGNQSYLSAQVSIRAPYDINQAARAMIGFENKDRNAGALYLEDDGRLKWISHEGVVKVIDWT